MVQQKMSIRDERSNDDAAIRRINECAFGGRDEADVVQALRNSGALTVSLVAEREGTAVGHIAFSQVAIEAAKGHRSAIGLGPMGVLPEAQRQGIGSLLVYEGLAALRREGHDAVVVLGHPQYYPRFGFVPAIEFGLRCEFDCPAEAFMAMELRPGALSVLRGGVVRYRPEFGV